MPTVDVVLPSLHVGQRKVVDNPARFQVLACGRRWGKTRLGAALCMETALKGGRAWWVAPSYKMGAVGWRIVKELAVQIPGASISLGDRMATLPGGGTVQVRSADDPDRLRGEGLDFCVMDECAFMKEDAWTHAIRPALSDRQGRAMFISTPKGRNWFHRLYQYGKDPHQSEYASWHFPTSDNPFIADVEIEAARGALPERIYRQEYLAEFIDDAGGVFRRVQDSATAEPQDEAIEGHNYCFGIDWGRHSDFTVITVWDMNLQAAVYIDRFTMVDYAIQIGRLKALARRFNPSVIMAELNAMGEPLVEQLQGDGLPVQGFYTTNKSKEQIIRDLEGAFERGDVTIINDPVLVSELQAIEQVRLANGWRFAAPEGMHDDCVISLALAYHAGATSWSIW